MPFEDSKQKKSEADNYWTPVEEQQKQEAERAGDKMSQAAWTPPVLDKGAGDRAGKPGDRINGRLELSAVYPIGEVDARAKAWQDYASLLRPDKAFNGGNTQAG
ncbi:MAG: hypothetical protein K2X27_02360, partial [Candidatus Obscuribacterales bacterium]|nr:hypothetical protein [Candidatus Obscuribacterales bacterium]